MEASSKRLAWSCGITQPLLYTLAQCIDFCRLARKEYLAKKPDAHNLCAPFLSDDTSIPLQHRQHQAALAYQQMIPREETRSFWHWVNYFCNKQQSSAVTSVTIKDS
eukprot:8975460-Ditylum_brightwellii.AAC.1